VAPAIVCAVKFNAAPAHTGELEVTVGVAGAGLTLTATVAEAPGHPATVANTV
jgi:hypothetical protein